jgi:hypothetical protein
MDTLRSLSRCLLLCAAAAGLLAARPALADDWESPLATRCGRQHAPAAASPQGGKTDQPLEITLPAR